MNIYDNFIENTGAKKPVLNIKEVLQGFKGHLQSIETSVISSYKQLNEIENKLSTNMYTVDYIKEYMAKTKESMNKNIEGLFNTKVAAMEKDLSNLKDKTLLTTGDKEISRNNILKLQSVLLNLSIEDKEQLFEGSKDKDPNVLEILYLNCKESNPAFAIKVMEYMDIITGEKEISLVESHIEQIKGLKSYLTYDFIKSQDTAYSEQTEYATLAPGGSISRTIRAYIEDIDKYINNIEE